jgi:drug/metabolite transporter (DMT)-like permease
LQGGGRAMSAGAASSPARSNEKLKGIAFLCAGALVFTLQDIVIKLVSGLYALPEILAIRCVVAVPPLILLIHLDGGLAQLRLRRPWVQLGRGALLLVSYASYYLSLAALPLAEAVALFFSAPLFIVSLAGPLLGEKVSLKRWLAVIVGFAGVVIVCRPGSQAMDPAALLSVGASASYALAQLMARRLGTMQRASIMSFTQNMVYLAAAAALGAVAGNGAFASSGHPSLQFLLRAWVVPPPGDLALIASTGIVAALGSWLLTHAYRIAEANVVAPFEYCSITWAVIAGILIWGEIPDAYTIVGVLVIVAAGIYVLRSGRQQR